MTKTKNITPFEQAKLDVASGKINAPTVNGGKIDYFGYQLAVHKFNLGIMAAGMLCRGIKFSDIKGYYGLKGRSAKDCIEQFNKILEDHKAELAAA